jgi:hypothetical protein
MFRRVPLFIIRSTPYTQQWYMSSRFADSLWAGSGWNWVPSWHITLLCVQWKAPDDGQRNCPKHAEFYFRNKFEKLVHLVNFTVRNLSRCTVTWTSNTTIYIFYFVIYLLFYYFVQWTNKCTHLFHKLSHCYMFRHYRVILRQLVINTLPSYTSISNAAVGNIILYNEPINAHYYFTNYHTATCFDTILSSSDSL